MSSAGVNWWQSISFKARFVQPPCFRQLWLKNYLENNHFGNVYMPGCSYSILFCLYLKYFGPDIWLIWWKFYPGYSRVALQWFDLTSGSGEMCLLMKEKETAVINSTLWRCWCTGMLHTVLSALHHAFILLLSQFTSEIQDSYNSQSTQIF